jgi:RimJ/RimL family protein N-acetyltransferase
MAAASSPASSFALRLAGPDDFDAYMDAFEAVAAEGRWMGAEAPLDREARRAAFDRAVERDQAVLYLADAGDNAGAGAEAEAGARTGDGAGVEAEASARTGDGAVVSAPARAGARRGGAIVGAIYASLSGGVVDLGMFVVGGHRGAGVGAALLEAVIDWARQQQAHKISLAVWPTNYPAIGLYARYGFRHEGTRRRHYRRRSGALWDATFMGLILDQDTPGGPGPAAAERPSIALPDGGIPGPPGSGMVLREWHRADIPAMVEAIDDPETRATLPHIPNPYTPADAEQWVSTTRVLLTAGTAAELAVLVDGSLAGSVGLRIGGPDGATGEVGYWVAAPLRRRGIASTAARVLADFGFDTLGLGRIELNAAVTNTASRRAAEKAGFELEGIRRAWRTVAGVPTDFALYARLADRP